MFQNKGKGGLNMRFLTQITADTKETFKAMSLWNSGAEKEDFVKKFGSKGGALYDKFEKEYGHACIPVHILHGFEPKEETDPVIRQHRGIDGPGKALREAIKQK